MEPSPMKKELGEEANKKELGEEGKEKDLGELPSSEATPSGEGPDGEAKTEEPGAG